MVMLKTGRARLVMTSVIVSSMALLMAIQPAQAHLEAKQKTLLGFDTCNKTTAATLDAWWRNATSYWSVGPYIGGATAIYAAGCYIVDKAWVDAVRSQGWALAFIWDDLQAPCTSNTYKIS